MRIGVRGYNKSRGVYPDEKADIEIDGSVVKFEEIATAHFEKWPGVVRIRIYDETGSRLIISVTRPKIS